MPKRWVTMLIGSILHCCDHSLTFPFSSANEYAVVFQGCVPVKWTAPEILFGDASNLSTKSDVYVLVKMF